MRKLRRSFRRRLLDSDLTALSRTFVGRVLEIGAGRGLRRGQFRPPTGLQWVHVDIDLAVRPDVQADIGTLPFPESTFDTLVCLEMLEYVSDLHVAFREFARVLRPSGRLVVSWPFVHHWDSDSDLWRLSPALVGRLAEQTGFRLSNQRAQGGSLASAANILLFTVWNSTERQIARWALLALAAIPLEVLFRLDRIVMRQRPALGRYSTGYLIVCERQEEALRDSARPVPQFKPRKS